MSFWKNAATYSTAKALDLHTVTIVKGDHIYQIMQVPSILSLSTAAIGAISQPYKSSHRITIDSDHGTHLDDKIEHQHCWTSISSSSCRHSSLCLLRVYPSNSSQYPLPSKVFCYFSSILSPSSWHPLLCSTHLPTSPCLKRSHPSKHRL